jgi:oxygen-independent coproporphyrinogen-3 oxidase
MNTTGLYLHIPFCIRKCPYCDFYSLPMEESLADAYVAAVNKVLRSGHFPVDEVDTVYFGGGTPSLLGAARLDAILQAISAAYTIAAGAEITLEVNPVSVAPEAFGELRAAGINRLSVGVQSAVAEELRFLGRLHGVDEAARCLEAAKAGGFENLSADLMLGLPGQTAESLAQSVAFLAEREVAHVSAYILKIEEGTPFHARGICPNDDEAADRYLECVTLLAERGYPQYEISNFAKPGWESRHNLKYWLGEPYLGIGPAAHSCLAGKRFFYARDVAGFLRDPLAVTDDGPAGDFEEYAMLRLRLTRGLDLAEAGRLYGVDKEALKQKALPYVGRGLARLEGEVLSLTPEGFLISNTIISSLL